MSKLKEILFLKSIKGFGKKTIYMRYYEELKKMKDLNSLKELVRCKDKRISDEELQKAECKAEELYNLINSSKEMVAITVYDELYPKKLNVMKLDRPLILYVKGDENALNEDNIAVIGTRKPCEWSVKVEERLVKKITELSGRVVISGLALGCDKIAHETVVNAKKKTIAVLPSGVNVITPTSHNKLAKDIIDNGGCLISEYEPDEKALKKTFVERDAIVAALSDIVLAIECEEKSGTMHTVRAANRYKTMIACYYDDNVDNLVYSGNKYMINSYGAKKISDTDDLRRLFEKPNKNNIETEPEQLTLDDLLNNKIKESI